MATTIRRRVIIEEQVDTLRINVPVRHGDEEIPLDFPLRVREPGQRYDRWIADIDLDSGRVKGWPAGRCEDVMLKVRDEGTYSLLRDGVVIVERTDCYVKGPRQISTDSDYIEMTIGADGVVQGWHSAVDLSDFECDPRDDE